MKKNHKRMEVANEVLAYIMPSMKPELVIKAGRIAVRWHQSWEEERPIVTKIWMTRNQDFYPIWHNRAPWGGTCSTAISQLVRWARHQPVLPLDVWRRWSQPGIQLFSGDRPLVLLQKAGYPEVVECVVCGNEPDGLDWWHYEGKSGPCCVYGCQAERIRGKA